MSLLHLPPDATADDVNDRLREHGYAIVDELVSPELMDQIQADMGPHIENTPFGKDNFVVS